MNSAYKCTSAPDSGATADDVSGLNVNIDAEGRGVTREIPRMNDEPDSITVAGSCISAQKVIDEPILLTVDKWRTNGSEIPATSRTHTAALNPEEMIRAITDQAVKGAIITHYAEYFDEWNDASLALCLVGAFFVYPDDASRTDGTDFPQQVRKRRKTNIYACREAGKKPSR